MRLVTLLSPCLRDLVGILTFIINFILLVLLGVITAKYLGGVALGFVVVLMMIMYFLYLKNIAKWQMKALIKEGYIL